MTYEEFRKAYPAIRCYEQYSGAQRADLAWARTGYRARCASGQFYYIHPLLPGKAYSTAKAATTAAYAVYQTQEEQ